MTPEKLDQLVSQITDRIIERLEQSETPLVITLGETTPEYTQTHFLQVLKAKNRKLPNVVYLVQRLSLASLSRIALLQGKSQVEKEVQQLFEQGETVYILNQGRGYLQAMETGNYGLKQQIRTFEEQLYRYGAEFINLSECKSHTALLSSRYITQKQLVQQGYQMRDTVYIEEHSRLTACAKEWIAEQKLSVQRVSDEQG